MSHMRASAVLGTENPTSHVHTTYNLKEPSLSERHNLYFENAQLTEVLLRLDMIKNISKEKAKTFDKGLIKYFPVWS